MKGMGEANKTVPGNPADLRQETAPSVHPEGRQPWQQELQAQGIQAVPRLAPLAITTILRCG